MSIFELGQPLWIVECDVCGVRFTDCKNKSIDFNSKRLATAVARSFGWMVGAHVVCAKCKKGGRK